MKRILGVVAGLVVWMLLASAAGLILRAAWPEYSAVAASMAFTLPMKVARLSIGALATIAAGLLTAVITRSTGAALVVGAVLLLLFIPQHVMLWNQFPVWYHLTFLSSLVPLSYAGGRMVVGSGT
jgi:hypothetical protein